MSSSKNIKTGKWYCSFRYTNAQGQRKQKKKEGFKTKKEALTYEREFIQKYNGSTDMLFKIMVELYLSDHEPRVRPTVFYTQKNTITNHILPFFGNMKLNHITPNTIRTWQTASPDCYRLG